MAKPSDNSVASVRLTTIDRVGIVRRALDAAFDKEKAILAKRETTLARRCYNAVFPLSVRKMVDALPDGWAQTTQKPGFNVGGLHIEFRTDEILPVPHSGSYRLGTIKDQALIDAANELQEAKRGHSERRKQAQAATEAIVESCTTTKQSRDVWPQGAPFYKHIEPAPRPQLPATQIKQLNEMLGLKAA